MKWCQFDKYGARLNKMSMNEAIATAIVLNLYFQKLAKIYMNEYRRQNCGGKFSVVYCSCREKENPKA